MSWRKYLEQLSFPAQWKLFEITGGRANKSQTSQFYLDEDRFPKYPYGVGVGEKGGAFWAEVNILASEALGE